MGNESSSGMQEQVRVFVRTSDQPVEMEAIVNSDWNITKLKLFLAKVVMPEDHAAKVSVDTLVITVRRDKYEFLVDNPKALKQGDTLVVRALGQLVPEELDRTVQSTEALIDSEDGHSHIPGGLPVLVQRLKANWASVLPLPRISLVMLGETGVGKSTLLHRYVYSSFAQSNTTGFTLRTVNLAIGNSRVRLHISDTYGVRKFEQFNLSMLTGAHGAVVAYDVSDLASFNRAEALMQAVNERYAQPGNTLQPGCIMLLGMKADTQTGYGSVGAFKRISYARGADLARKHRALFFETSARDSVNVLECFNQLAATTYVSLVGAGKFAAPVRRASVHLAAPGGIRGTDDRPAIEMSHLRRKSLSTVA